MFRVVRGYVFTLVCSSAFVALVLNDNEDDGVRVKVQSQLLD